MRTRLIRLLLTVGLLGGAGVTAYAGPAFANYSSTCTIGSDAVLTSFHGVSAWKVFGGGTFYAGAYCQIGKSQLVMQGDGNLVLYDENSHPRWASNTNYGPMFAEFQTDGNFVVYETDGLPRWASNTCCHSSWQLAIQADGNVVIYDGNGVAQWATHTNH